MITLSPINKDIRETLDKKSAMLKAGAGRDIYKDDDNNIYRPPSGFNGLRILFDIYLTFISRSGSL